MNYVFIGSRTIEIDQTEMNELIEAIGEKADLSLTAALELYYDDRAIRNELIGEAMFYRKLKKKLRSIVDEGTQDQGETSSEGEKK